MNKKTIAAFSLMLSSLAFSQNINLLKEMSQEINYNSKNQIELIKLKSEVPVYENNAVAFIEQNILPPNFKLKQYSAEKDNLGYTHYKFQVAYNNVLITNKTILVHCLSGKIVSVNGDLLDYKTPANTIQLDKNIALQKAITKVNAEKYMWENKEAEHMLKEMFNNPHLTLKPKGELELFSTSDNGVYRYAYKFNIYAEKPLYKANVFIDAENGVVLAEHNQIHTADVPATAQTRFSGVQTMTVDNVSAGLYRLRETGRGLGIETFDLNTSQNFTSAIDYTNTTTSWTTTTIKQVGTDAHWGAEMVYDYYINEHSRNSIDNAGHKLVSYSDYGVGYQNAFWNGMFMTYGSGGNGGFTGLDICGHEVTHGLTEKSANLVYQNESGALNESYSDIFGACIENYAKPATFNWTIGEDIGGIRSMSNPNSFGDPDTYGGLNWYTGTGDNGGVHTNSGVSNYWFYLLCQGGTGVNDKANSYTVSALGMTKAAKIAFRALTVYYSQNTNYISARNLSIQAAVDLYGPCSNEVFQVKSAWYAVGVGASPSGTATPVANFSSVGGSPCSLPFNVNFVNTSFGSDTYSWDFGDGSAVSTATNPAHTYTANGVYTVKLKAISSCAATPDSIIKNAYITVNALNNSVGTGAAVCDSGAVNLSATGTDLQYWYTSPTATGTPVFIGNSFTTPVINTTTTYYVVNTATNPAIYGGPATNTIGTGANFPGNTAYDSMNVIQPCILKSVVVYAGTTAPRIIELRNSSNTVVQSTTVNLTAGTNTVNLNFKLNPGYGYRLGLGAGTAQLYRNNSGVTYPYNIGSLLSITGSSSGPSTFFFFYNWEVQPVNCTSAPTAVTATINSVPQLTISPTVTLACVDDGSVAITTSPSGGTLSGTGISGNAFNPSVGTGTYAINYSVTDGNGCSRTDAVNIVVSPCIGIEEINGVNNISVYPNPFNEIITFNGLTNEKNYIVITDAVGHIVYNEMLNNNSKSINLSSFAQGIYIIEVRSDDSVIHRSKLIKQ